MTSSPPDKSDALSQVLFNVLADINIGMMTIWENVASDAAVNPTRDCDIRRYRDFMSEEEYCCFEVHVAVETRAGVGFSWSLDIRQSSLGWTVWRRVSKQTTGGEDLAKEFEDHTFGTVDDLANNVPRLMVEFVES